MFVKIIFVICLVVSISSVYGQTSINIKNTQDIKRFLEKGESSELVGILRDFLKNSKPNRFPGTVGHKSASDYIQKYIKSFTNTARGEKVFVQKFTPNVESAIEMYKIDFEEKIKSKLKSDHVDYKKWDKFTKGIISVIKTLANQQGENIVWEKRGVSSPKDLLIVSAHYDTIAFDLENNNVLTQARMPGADDNGTGVAILLKLVEYLSKIDLKKSVRVVFFDMQETGFLGSRYFVSQLKKEIGKSESPAINFEGLINLDMLGHDTVSFDLQKKHGNMKLYIRKESQEGYQSDKRLADYFIKMGEVATHQINFPLEANGFDMGDNEPFWLAGLPAITFSQDWENDFNWKANHTSSDIVETLNIETLYNSFRYISMGIMAWLCNLDR